MTSKEKAIELIKNPVAIGWALGYKDLRPELHGKWIKEMVTNDEDMTLQAHRNSFKTTCLCIAIALLMVLKRMENIIFLRKTDSDVAEVITNVARILNSDIIKEIYYALTGEELGIMKCTTTEITTNVYTAPKGSAQLVGIGIGGSLTGKHADVIITDDIINLKDRQSRAERERTKAIYQELQNIKSRGGRIINTGTPWHKEDAFSLMPKAEKYNCYETGLMTKTDIDKLRKSMAPSLFAANYELQHIASENALFTKAPEFFDNPEMLKNGICHIDAAYGGEDYTAFTCCKRVGNKLYMYGKLWQRHVDTVLDICISEAQRLMCAPLYTEKNADKGFVAVEINKRGLPAKTYSEKENKYVKISTFLRKWWEDIVWLEGTDREYLDQIMDYTEDAEHDDAPDSAACMCRIFDKRSGENYVSPFGR